MEKAPTENPLIRKSLEFQAFHEHEYEPWPAMLETTQDLIDAIETGWLSLYGIKKGPGGYTLAFSDENSDSCYTKEGFSEADTIKILERI